MGIKWIDAKSRRQAAKTILLEGFTGRTDGDGMPVAGFEKIVDGDVIIASIVELQGAFGIAYEIND